jgi:hypothetical protein
MNFVEFLEALARIADALAPFPLGNLLKSLNMLNLYIVKGCLKNRSSFLTKKEQIFLYA